MDKLVDAIRSRLHNNSQPPTVDLSGNSVFTSTGEPQQLAAAVSANRNVRRVVNSLASAQHSAVQQLLRWASREPNAAIRDVVHQISELDFMWLESQTDFKADLVDFERTLSCIVDIEEQSINCVSKAKKETKVATKQRQLLANVQNAGVPAAVNNSQAEQADLAVQATLRENEVQKLLHLKKSLSNLAKAYVKLGEHCSIIFEAQRRIASLLPDAEASVSDCPQLSDVRYEGAETSRALVAAARAKLAKCGGRKCTCRCGGRRHRSTSRVKRRCSEPVPRPPTESSESEYEGDDSVEQEAAPIPAPPPYNLASAPIIEQKDVDLLSSKFEEVMALSSVQQHQPSLYPPIPVQVSTAWQSPPPYLVNQRR